MASPVLNYGDQGSHVEELQTLLNKQLPIDARGDYEEGLPINGKFGPITKEFVQIFQSTAHLKMDAIVGKKTWAALRGTELYNCFDMPTNVFSAPDDFTCWAAATGMLKGFVAPDMTQPAGVTFEYQQNGQVGGLENSDQNMKLFAKGRNLGSVTGQNISCSHLCNLLTMFSRLMINMRGVTSRMANGLAGDSHLVIVAGLRGDGTPSGTTITLIDTSPIPGDPIKTASYSYYLNRFPQMTYQAFYSYTNRSKKIY